MGHVNPQVIAALDGVRLRRTAEADLDAVLAAEHAPACAPFVAPWVRQRHGAALVDGDFLHAVVETAAGERLVGFILLAGLESVHQSIELRRIVISDQGKGHGRRALRMVKRLAFVEYAAHRLWLDVFERNRRAIHLHASERFIVDGLLRECYRRGDGRFDSLLVMSILDREYRASGQD
jgi:diamine N-acetyltransferase